MSDTPIGPTNYLISVFAEVARLKAELAAAKAELDLAIAHDRQPYPTADAYEKVCAARAKWQERAEKAEAERDAQRGELGRFQASRIQLNDDGSLDEIVGSPGHLEQLDTNHWFVCLGDFAVWLHAKGKITASYEDRAAIDAARAK